jgi:hypothetical protein
MEINGTSVQAVIKNDVEWDFFDNASLKDVVAMTDNIQMTYATRLNRYSLARGTDGFYYFMWHSHHSVFDGWSLGLVINTLMKCYYNTETHDLKPYSGFISYISKIETSAAEAYWREQLLGAQRASFPPQPSSGSSTTQAVTKTISLPGSLSSSSITKATVIRAAWAMVLAAVSMYLLIRFGVTNMIRKYTVHRGMFHSIPAGLIFTGVAFLLCGASPGVPRRKCPDGRDTPSRSMLSSSMNQASCSISSCRIRRTTAGEAPVASRTSLAVNLPRGIALRTASASTRDVRRALPAEGTLAAFTAEVHRAAGATSRQELVAIGKQAIDAVDHAAAWLGRARDAGDAALQHGARRFGLTLGRALQAALLAQQAQHDLDVHGDARAAAVARRFTDEGLDLLETPGTRTDSDAALAGDVPLAVDAD